MFKVYLNDTNKYLFTVSNTRELQKGLIDHCLTNSTFVIRNEKGEPCDNHLNVIPSPMTSMDSMVGLLQNKFQSKRK